MAAQNDEPGAVTDLNLTRKIFGFSDLTEIKDLTDADGACAETRDATDRPSGYQRIRTSFNTSQ